MSMPHGLYNNLDRLTVPSTGPFSDDPNDEENNDDAVGSFTRHRDSAKSCFQNEENGRRPSLSSVHSTPHDATTHRILREGAKVNDGNHETGANMQTSSPKVSQMPINEFNATEVMQQGIGSSPCERRTDNKLEVVDEDVNMQSGSISNPLLNEVENEVDRSNNFSKLSSAKLLELACSPKLSSVPDPPNRIRDAHTELLDRSTRKSEDVRPVETSDGHVIDSALMIAPRRKGSGSVLVSPSVRMDKVPSPITIPAKNSLPPERPSSASRTVSTPLMRRTQSSHKSAGLTQAPVAQSKSSKAIPNPLELNISKATIKPQRIDEALPSPMPTSMPLPPFSIPTHLHLELSSEQSSPLYIHRSVSSDFPYESSQVKIERLLNFLLLPPQLEHVLWFGALACLDAWLYSFTILPLRFLRALYILCLSWAQKIAMEVRVLGAFIYAGTGRMWQRRRRRPTINLQMSTKEPPLYQGIPNTPRSFVFPVVADLSNPQLQSPLIKENPSSAHSHPEPGRKRHYSVGQKHRRTKSPTSALSPGNKADLLQGLLILISCMILMYFDASMMYHSIRGQAAIKLYVIYNVLEVSTPARVL